MTTDNQNRRVKKTGAAAHRTGEKRAAVKPHKTSTQPSQTTGTGAQTTSNQQTSSAQTAAANVPTLTIKQAIYQFMGSLNNVRLTQSAWGDSLGQVAAILQQNYGLSSNDEPYLLNDPTGTSTGKAGLLLSTTGIHLSDGKGGLVALGWQDLKRVQVGYKQGMLVIGQNGIQTSDGEVIAALLQHVQARLA